MVDLDLKKNIIYGIKMAFPPDISSEFADLRSIKDIQRLVADIFTNKRDISKRQCIRMIGFIMAM